jgi:sugar phosphate isomerase/epimerase
MMQLGLNLEFARSERLDLAQALRAAAEAGYPFVEPYVYSEVCLSLNSHLTVHTTSSYHHLNANRADVTDLSRLRNELGLRFSAFDAHTSLLLPQLGVPHLRRVLDLVAEMECPLVMSECDTLAQARASQLVLQGWIQQLSQTWSQA